MVKSTAPERSTGAQPSSPTLYDSVTQSKRMRFSIHTAMKTLFLIRHAKSSWDDPALSDKDRPLSDRGRRDAPKMGKRLAKRDVKPDLILSSPARRALLPPTLSSGDIVIRDGLAGMPRRIADYPAPF